MDAPSPRSGPPEILAALTLLGLTLAATWPWVVQAPWSTTQPDAAFTALNLQHIQEWLVGQAEGLWTTRLARPLHDTLTSTDWVMGEALLGLPAYLLGLPPMVVHHSVSVCGIWLTAYACHRMAKALTGPGLHTLAAGVFGGLGPTMLAHAHHVNLVQRYLVVAGAGLLVWGVVARAPARAVLGGLVAGAAWHFGLYCGMHASLAFALAAGVAVLATPSRREVLAGCGAWLAVTLTAAPIYLRYAAVVASNPTEMAGARMSHDVMDLLAPLRPLDGVLVHAPATWLWSALRLGDRATFDPVFPGVVLALLLGIGLVAFARGGGRGPGWVWGVLWVVGMAGAALAVGPSLHIAGHDTHVPGPYAVLVRVPGLVALRDPSRWVELTMLALTPMAALGAREVIAWSRGGRARRGVMALGVVWMGLEWVPTELPRGAIRAHPVYASLAKRAPGRVMDSSLTQRRMDCGCGRNMALNAALSHTHDLVGGRYARMTRREVELGRILDHWPKPDARELFAHAGVDLLVVHPGDPAPPRGAACEAIGKGAVAHKLCALEPIDDVTLWPWQAFEPVAEPPFDAVRVPYVPMRRGTALDAAELSCGGGPPARKRIAVWSLLSAIRHGIGEPPAVDIVLDARCDAPITADRDVQGLRRVGTP